MFPMRAKGEATVNRRRAVVQSASPLQERCGSRGGSCCGRALLLPGKTAAVAVWRLGGGAGKCCVCVRELLAYGTSAPIGRITSFSAKFTDAPLAEGKFETYLHERENAKKPRAVRLSCPSCQ